MKKTKNKFKNLITKIKSKWKYKEKYKKELKENIKLQGKIIELETKLRELELFTDEDFKTQKIKDQEGTIAHEREIKRELRKENKELREQIKELKSK